MIRTAVARRYATALFEVALERNELESTQEGLDCLASVGRSVPVLISCLDNIEIPTDRRCAVVDSVCAELKITELLRGFLKILVSSRRSSIIQDVTTIHRELMARALNFTQATAAVADSSVADEVRRRVESVLEKKLGRPARCIVNVQPDLIGGAMVRIGDRTLDASVAGRLDRLKDTLLGE
jgi:F-type H+-transporting ATPase subunit delta